MSDIYDHIQVGHKPSADWKLPVITIGGLMLFSCLTVIIVTAMSIQYGFNRFYGELQACTLYAERERSFQICQQGEPLSRDELMLAGQIDHIIAGAGAGRKLKVVPEEDDLVISYGNGCTLRLWERELLDRSMGHGGEVVHGAAIVFTNHDGDVYAYTSTRIDYPALLAYLRGETDDYCAPYSPYISNLLLMPEPPEIKKPGR